MEFEIESKDRETLNEFIKDAKYMIKPSHYDGNDIIPTSVNIVDVSSNEKLLDIKKED